MKHYLDDKWLILIALNLIVIMGIFLFKGRTSIEQTQDLSSIESQLSQIESKLSIKKPVIDFSALNHQFQQLKQLIQQIPQQDNSQLGALVTSGQNAINSQLNKVSLVLSQLSEQQQPFKYLTNNELPFKLLSIDSLQQTSVATVSYAYKTQALEKGDFLAGWKVIDIDFARQYIEFENADKAHVALNLQSQEVING